MPAAPPIPPHPAGAPAPPRTPPPTAGPGPSAPPAAGPAPTHPGPPAAFTTRRRPVGTDRTWIRLSVAPDGDCSQGLDPLLRTTLR
ncbi:hypothetical protein ACOZD1_11655, partial [Streptomyces rhizosphaericola]